MAKTVEHNGKVAETALNQPLKTDQLTEIKRELKKEMLKKEQAKTAEQKMEESNQIRPSPEFSDALVEAHIA